METSQAGPSAETVGASGAPLAGLRPYEERDRPAALEILRRRMRQGDVPLSMHRGEWHWWLDHDDPRLGRADAARLSFRSTMDPDMHRARYRPFMASPAYQPDNDLVVIAPDGEVAAFAIVWPDDDLGSGQFEPVGTQPGHVRKGLGRAVVTAGLHRLRELGMHTARVLTEESRTPAVTLYLACGFQQVDRLRTWLRRDRQD